jgi:succinoglycan biosynthesis transport protein ExoP
LLPDLEVGDDDEPGLLSSILGMFSGSEGEPGPSAEETMASAVGKLQQWLDVRRKGLTLIILVQYTHADPKIAAKIANAIVKSYLDEQQDGKARVTQSVAEKLRLRVAELRKELYSAELRLEEYKERSLAKNDVNLFELERQAKVTSDLYLSLLARLSEAEAAKGLIYADARVVAQATEPQAPSVPGKLIPLVLALMGGVGVGVALALIKDHLSTTIRHPDDAASALGIPIVGSTPLVNADRDTITREVLTDRSSLFSQSIFSIKHSLLGGGGRPAPQLVAFVSALPGEGKSVLAANFAHYAASSGLKTLLVDCNLREPQLTMLLAPASKKSFVDLAKREAEMDDVLVRDTDSGLYFCPGQHGEFSGNPMEILASQEMAEFLGACRQVFDLVVLDTSALLPVVDARALVKTVDVAILVLECGRTSTDDAKQALWTDPTLVSKACAVLNKST